MSPARHGCGAAVREVTMRRLACVLLCAIAVRAEDVQQAETRLRRGDLRRQVPVLRHRKPPPMAPRRSPGGAGRDRQARVRLRARDATGGIAPNS